MASLVSSPVGLVGVEAVASRRRGRRHATATPVVSAPPELCFSLNARGEDGIPAVLPFSQRDALRGEAIAVGPARFRASRSDVLVAKAAVGGAGTAPAEEGSGTARFNPAMRVPLTAKVNIGTQLGGGQATLERTGIDLSQQAQTMNPKTDDGGSGGDSGNKVNNGGGGDGDDNGDDDDYFNKDGDDGKDDGFFRREEIKEIFDRKTLEAVLAEWHKTLANLPGGLKMAVEMGLVSSVQLVRFLAVDCRPTVARLVTRSLPPAAARAFVGRLMADPQFVLKLLGESALAAGSAAAYEWHVRGDKLGAEADLALVAVLARTAATAGLVWSLAPSRSYGAAFKHPWQSMLHALPNHAFDSCGPQRAYTLASRAAAFGVKAAEMSALGLALGAASAGASHALAAARRAGGNAGWEPSVPLPGIGAAALSLGAVMGLSGNARYQLVGGAERLGARHLASLPMVLMTSGLLRYVNQSLSESHTLAWLGLPSTATAAVKRRWAAATAAATVPTPMAGAAVAVAGAGGAPAPVRQGFTMGAAKAVPAPRKRGY